MRRRIAILIVGVLLATGCQPGVDVDILDPTLRPPTPTYSPSVDLPTEDIAAMFLAAVEESNAALAAAEARFPNRTALNDHLVYYAALADAEARFLEQIKAIPWPVDLYDDASNLIEASTVYESRLRSPQRCDRWVRCRQRRAGSPRPMRRSRQRRRSCGAHSGCLNPRADCPR